MNRNQIFFHFSAIPLTNEINRSDRSRGSVRRSGYRRETRCRVSLRSGGETARDTKLLITEISEEQAPGPADVLKQRGHATLIFRTVLAAWPTTDGASKSLGSYTTAYFSLPLAGSRSKAKVAENPAAIRRIFSRGGLIPRRFTITRPESRCR